MTGSLTSEDGDPKVSLVITMMKIKVKQHHMVGEIKKMTAASGDRFVVKPATA